MSTEENAAEVMEAVRELAEAFKNTIALKDADDIDRLDLAEHIQSAIEEWLQELEQRQKIEPTCLHAKKGLCLPCYRDYLEDPTAWAEYGYHPQGEANTKALFAELAAMPPVTEPPVDLPF